MLEKMLSFKYTFYTHTQFHQAKPAKRPDIVKINSIIFCKNVISFFFFFVFTQKTAGGEKWERVQLSSELKFRC